MNASTAVAEKIKTAFRDGMPARFVQALTTDDLAAVARELEPHNSFDGRRLIVELCPLLREFDREVLFGLEGSEVLLVDLPADREAALLFVEAARACAPDELIFDARSAADAWQAQQPVHSYALTQNDEDAAWAAIRENAKRQSWLAGGAYGDGPLPEAHQGGSLRLWWD
jgi:hypothetical protein